jgi:hypothetical protein
VTTVLAAGALTLVVLSVSAIFWSLLSQRAAARYRRRDALDIVHYLARRRSGSSKRR